MSWSRQTYYSGQQPIETQLLQQERDAAKALWQWIADSLGNKNSQFTGLTAAVGSGLTITIAPGALYSNAAIDSATWSSLSSDTSLWMLQGLVTSSQTLSGFAAPTVSGQSIDYLIQAEISVTDTAAAAMNFYNSSTPSNPTVLQKSYSRVNQVVFNVKAGTAATTGTQVAPSSDPGAWVPLWVVTVDYGETSLTSADIVLAAGAPQFTGFVPLASGGPNFVQLSPASRQTGYINVSGAVSGSTVVTTNAQFGGAALVSHFAGAWASGFNGDYLNLTSVGFTGSKQASDSLDIAGSIGYTGTHAGTDADPWPLSQINAGMLGGKLPSDYALASGNYITVYSGTPTLASGNAGVSGYFQSGIATGTAPFVVASTTMVSNLNAQYLGGYVAGNASGDIPISNGTLNTNLNAQYLNGLASSAFQLAGSYAAMNTSNSGYFQATSFIASTGGTGSVQVQAGYVATNSWGINSSGAVAYLQSNAAPLALIGASVRTNGPLYVGDATKQDIYMQDAVPSGMVRAGFCPYALRTINGGSIVGYVGSWLGEVSGQAMATWIEGGNNPGYWSYSNHYYTVSVTFASSVTVSFQGTMTSVYINGSKISGISGLTFTYTFNAGTYTVMLAFEGQYASGQTTSLSAIYAQAIGWLPMSNGQISGAIVSIVPI